jgi:sensor c-di-GMP phosphodiesterase-like protein
MPMKRRRRLSILALALLGTLLGAASGYWMGHATLLRSANDGLSSYAASLIEHSDEYTRELREIKRAFNPSPDPYCSQQEILRMQKMTFQSLQVKEIGRTHDGKFYCSAFLGKLNSPLPLPPLTMLLADGTRVYTNVVVTVAGSARGTIMESGDVDVVLSPNAFDHWGRQHVRYMVVVVNRKTQQMAQIAGEKLDADLSWILSGQQRRLNGVLWRSACSNQSPVCIVTAESTKDVLASSGALLIEYVCMGGLAGFGLGLAIGQFYLQRIGLAQQLRRAVRRGDLKLVYQPILSLPSRDCAGAEVLVRWSDEDGRPIAPDFFIGIAEDRGFVSEITAFVVRRSIQDVGDVLRRHPELTLSINIAAVDLENDELFWLLEEHVRQAGIAPRQVALELTERSTADMTVLSNAVLRLHREGYQVHIDDFGTGFSSLAYLHELEVDAIKIDRAFTRTIGTDAVTASILPQILALAESLQVEVIVEGVETQAQADYLVSTGRRMQAQGWYFGKPMNATELPKYREMSQNAAAAAAGGSGVPGGTR